MTTPDVYCPCGCRERYYDDAHEQRCCMCREILPGNCTSCSVRGPYLRDSDWMGKGEIVEFLMKQYNEFCKTMYFGEDAVFSKCARCGSWQYKLDAESVCWLCREKEATDDDGC